MTFTLSFKCFFFLMTFFLISFCQEELEELQVVVDAERDKFSQQRITVQQEITTQVTEVHLYKKFTVQHYWLSIKETGDEDSLGGGGVG